MPTCSVRCSSVRASLSRKIPKLESEKKLSAVSKLTYTVEQLAVLNPVNRILFKLPCQFNGLILVTQHNPAFLLKAMIRRTANYRAIRQFLLIQTGLQFFVTA